MSMGKIANLCLEFVKICLIGLSKTIRRSRGCTASRHNVDYRLNSRSQCDIARRISDDGNLTIFFYNLFNLSQRIYI